MERIASSDFKDDPNIRVQIYSMSSLYWNHKEMRDLLRPYGKVVMVDPKTTRGLCREYYECYLHVEKLVRIPKEMLYHRPTSVIYDLKIKCFEEPL